MTGSENEKLFVRALRQACQERFDAAMRQTPDFSASGRHRRFMRRLLDRPSAESAQQAGHSGKGIVHVRRLPAPEGSALSHSLSAGHSQWGRRLAAALLIGLLIALGAGLCVAATLTKLEDGFDISKRLEVGEAYEDGILSVYRCRVDAIYSCVEDWLQAGSGEYVYPSVYPSDGALEKIWSFKREEFDQVHFVYSDSRYVFVISDEDDIDYQLFTPFVYNGMQYFLWLAPERSAYQATWVYDGRLYHMVAPSLEDLFCMIEGLVYPFDGEAA